MRKVILSALTLLALASALVFASAAGAGKDSLVVAMRDPGCHWFQAGGKYTKSAVRSGAVVLTNHDEAGPQRHEAGARRREVDAPRQGRLPDHDGPPGE